MSLSTFSNTNPQSKQQKELFIAWGLYQVLVGFIIWLNQCSVNYCFISLYGKRAISFLNNDVQLHHHSISLGNILVNQAGGNQIHIKSGTVPRLVNFFFLIEWKLGGFEYAASTTDFPIKILPSLEKYDPPEKSDSSKMKLSTKWLNFFHYSKMILPCMKS